MKNIIRKIKNKLVVSTIIITAFLGLYSCAMTTFAATTATISPAIVNVSAGQRFSIVISVNPQGGTDYAEKIDLKFPQDMIEVVSFTPAPVWIAMNQSGYDITDNINGIIVKTAGYPSGISSQTSFATVSFLAKKSGIATVSLGENSISFQVSSQGKIVGNVSTITIKPKTSISGQISKTIVASTTSASSTVMVLPQDAGAVESINDLKDISKKYFVTIIILSIIIVSLIAYIAYIKKDQDKI